MNVLGLFRLSSDQGRDEVIQALTAVVRRKTAYIHNLEDSCNELGALVKVKTLRIYELERMLQDARWELSQARGDAGYE
jgi:hypothetical protein